MKGAFLLLMLALAAAPVVETRADEYDGEDYEYDESLDGLNDEGDVEDLEIWLEEEYHSEDETDEELFSDESDEAEVSASGEISLPEDTVPFPEEEIPFDSAGALTYSNDYLSATAIPEYSYTLPEGTVLKVARVTPETAGSQYDTYMEALGAADEDGTAADEDNTLLFEVAFLVHKTDEDGDWVTRESDGQGDSGLLELEEDGVIYEMEEVRPEGAVNVSVTFLQEQLSGQIALADGNDASVYRLSLGGDDGEDVSPENISVSAVEDAYIETEWEETGFTASSSAVYAVKRETPDDEEISDGEETSDDEELLDDEEISEDEELSGDEELPADGDPEDVNEIALPDDVIPVDENGDALFDIVITDEYSEESQTEDTEPEEAEAEAEPEPEEETEEEFVPEAETEAEPEPEEEPEPEPEEAKAEAEPALPDAEGAAALVGAATDIDEAELPEGVVQMDEAELEEWVDSPEAPGTDEAGNEETVNYDLLPDDVEPIENEEEIREEIVSEYYEEVTPTPEETPAPSETPTAQPTEEPQQEIAEELLTIAADKPGAETGSSLSGEAGTNAGKVSPAAEGSGPADPAAAEEAAGSGKQGSAEIYVNLDLVGRSIAEEDDFRFTLLADASTAENGASVAAPMPENTTMKVTGSDAVSFGKIQFTKAGTYNYKVVEEVPGGAVFNSSGQFEKDGVVYDPVQHTVQIRVAEAGGEKLSTAVYYDGAETGTLTVTNTYTSAEAMTIAPKEITSLPEASPSTAGQQSGSVSRRVGMNPLIIYGTLLGAAAVALIVLLILLRQKK